jgi:SAM-dependent methyltransferase
MTHQKDSFDIAADPATVPEAIMTGIASEANVPSLITRTNRDLEQASSVYWGDTTAGRAVADRALKQFEATAAALESLGWQADRIQKALEPSRQVLATSAFVERCQRWTRGYAGDFETIEHLVSGVNRSVPGTLGWHFEEILLQSPIVRQHRNKLTCQSLEIAHAIGKSRIARVLSAACGGALDLLPVLPCLPHFAGEIVLNDCEPAALETAAQRLRPVTARFRLEPGNVLRVVRQLVHGARFDLVVAGGLFDYLPDRAIVFLLRVIFQDLLAPGGILLFTNIATGNPARTLMEYAANWTLIERSESRIVELSGEAGIPEPCLQMTREETGLTLTARVVRPSDEDSDAAPGGRC